MSYPTFTLPQTTSQPTTYTQQPTTYTQPLTTYTQQPTTYTQPPAFNPQTPTTYTQPPIQQPAFNPQSLVNIPEKNLLPGITVIGYTNIVPASNITMEDFIRQDESELDSEFTVRKRMTRLIAQSDNMNPLTAVSMGYMWMNKFKYGVTYDESVEKVLQYNMAKIVVG